MTLEICQRIVNKTGKICGHEKVKNHYVKGECLICPCKKFKSQAFVQCDFHPHDEFGRCLTEDRLKKKSKSCGGNLKGYEEYGWINCGDILDKNEDIMKPELCPNCKPQNNSQQNHTAIERVGSSAGTSLSDKIVGMGEFNIIHEEDVKEFIKQLKDELPKAKKGYYLHLKYLNSFIDKLAGKELI